VAALITNQIEVSAVLVTLEGLNADVKKPASQCTSPCTARTPKYKMEQFVVRSGLADKVRSLADFKGLKLMSAPGPANLNTAKGILAKVGLKDGDYTIDQLDMGQHVNAMKAGTFDGGYTLEPSATIMHNLGIADTIESGVIAKYIWAVRTPTLTLPAVPSPPTSLLSARRCQALRASLAKAIDYIRANPEAARKYLAKNTMTPDNIVDTVPMLGYIMTKDMSPKQLGYLQELRISVSRSASCRKRSTSSRTSNRSEACRGAMPNERGAARRSAASNGRAVGVAVGRYDEAAARHHPRPLQALRQSRHLRQFDLDIPRGE